MPADDKQAGQHAFRFAHGLVQATQGFQKHVDPLVPELVAAGGHDDPGPRGELPAQETAGGGEDPFPGFAGWLPVFRQVRDVLHVQAVGRDDIGAAAEEILGFRCRDFADGGETVRLPGRGRFHGVFGRDLMGPGLPLRRDVLHGGVDVHSRAGQAAAQDRGVGGENRGDFRRPALQAEQSGSAHPFMKLSDGRRFLRAGQEVVEGFDDFPAGVAEHDRLHVIPPAGDGIHSVILPDPEEELILVVLFPEADEDHPRFAGDLPSPESAGDLLDGDPFADPLPEGVLRLLKLEIGFQVRTEQDVPVAVGRRGLPELTGDHRVDAADLVADLPAHFEEIAVWIRRHGFHPLPAAGFRLSRLEKSFSMFM